MKPPAAISGFYFTRAAPRGSESPPKRDGFRLNYPQTRRCRFLCSVVLQRNVRPVEPKPNGDLMTGNYPDRPVDHNKPVFDQIHPRIYAIAVGLVAWFALAAWVLFDHSFGRPSEVSLQLAMMSVLFLVAILLPWALSRIWTRYRMPYDEHSSNAAFREWRLGDFSVWGARIKGSHAAIDVLLPLAAVAFGLTAIGIVFLIDASFAA
jgi:hypothetical protein